MNGKQRTKNPWLVGGATLVMLGALLVSMVGGVGAAPVAPAATSSTAWAYGGSNTTSSGTVTVGNLTVSWSTSISVVEIFNATPTGPSTTELSLQRTVSVSVSVSAHLTNGSSASIDFSALEVDNAYANVTNASTVYVGASPVPALGLDNSSLNAHASVAESAVVHVGPRSAFGYFNASGALASSVQFAPSFGLVPLNLTGVTAWNSTTVASPHAAWNFSYDYNFNSWNGTTASGHGAANGSWATTAVLALTGEVVTAGIPHFSDHHARSAIVLLISGGADLYDGFVVVPVGFDLFGSGSVALGAHAGGLGAATISSDELFLDHGQVRADSFTAAQVTVGTSGTVGLVTGVAGAHPSAGTAAGTVTEQPESVSAAQQQAHCLQFGCSAAPWFSGMVAFAVIGALIAAVVGTVGVIEWKSYARRKNSSNQLVGGYAAGLTNGVPPAAVNPPAVVPPAVNGPETPTGPGRQS